MTSTNSFSQNKKIVTKSRSQLAISESDEESDESSDHEEHIDGLERFLAAWGLEEHLHM